ncbi:MAG: NAD(P)H-binding protein [Bacteroidota bacterium]
MKEAIIIGATGLVGKELLRESLADPYFDKVRIFVRRNSGIDHPKLVEEVVDFDDIEKWKDKIKGDILFSALGTTRKKAGSKKIQYKVDYSYQFNVAKAASENGVPDYVLISAPGASPDSIMFYSHLKGELDRDVKALPFSRIIYIKPSILSGEREDERKGEKIGLKIAGLFQEVPLLKKYRPIEGNTVAKAMINASKKEKTERLEEYKLDDLFFLAEG